LLGRRKGSPVPERFPQDEAYVFGRISEPLADQWDTSLEIFSGVPKRSLRKGRTVSDKSRHVCAMFRHDMKKKAKKKQISRTTRFYEYDAKNPDLSPVLSDVFLEIMANPPIPGMAPPSVSFHASVDGSIRGAYIGPSNVRRLIDWLTVWSQDHPEGSQEDSLKKGDKARYTVIKPSNRRVGRYVGTVFRHVGAR
jgi:hypothetical protein